MDKANLVKRKMTLKERLQRSLEVKRNNLLKKKEAIQKQFEVEMADVKEKLEVIELQLTGLNK